MAGGNNFVACNCLCFIVNKIGKVPLKALKSLALDFYSSEELSEAKDLLLKEVDGINIANLPKIARKRRDSTGKTAQEFDDIYQAVTFIDEKGLLDKPPAFVATNPEKLPSVRLMEGDLEIVMIKLRKLEEIVDIMQCDLYNKNVLSQQFLSVN